MSKTSEEIEVKDQRRKSFYIADNRMIDEAAPLIGVYGGAVYNSLLRHADKDRKTWPSVTMIAKEWGVGRALVIRELKKLECLHMISIERQKGQHNVYRICDQDEWRLNKVTSSAQIPVEDGTSSTQIPVEDGTSSAQIPPLVSQENSKYTHITKPKKDLLSEMLFEGIITANPHSRLCVLTKKQKETRIKDWAGDIEKLERIDKQRYDLIEIVIKKALEDKFWSKNILSGAALRKNWDRLTHEFVKDKKPPGENKHRKDFYSQGRDGQWFLNGVLISADRVPEQIRKKVEGRSNHNPPPPVAAIVNSIADKFKTNRTDAASGR